MRSTTPGSLLNRSGPSSCGSHVPARFPDKLRRTHQPRAHPAAQGHAALHSPQALETLPADASLLAGTPIGKCQYAGVEQTVCIPADMRVKHTQIIGVQGTGKSSDMREMARHDIRRGEGVVVIDPHGSLIEELLCFIPPEHAERIIYFNPGDAPNGPGHVPIWNPLLGGPGANPGRIADNLVSAFKSVVDGWGDRLEHLSGSLPTA